MTHEITGPVAVDWILGFDDGVARTRDRLTELDRLAGDGDFGTNVSSALRRVRAGLPPRDSAAVGTVFHAASRGFLATGGTSGPLFGMWLREIARAGETADAASRGAAALTAIAAGIASGLATVQRLGGAAVGDNTMIDALAPASDALGAAARSGVDPVTALDAAAEAARAGALSTGALIASRGRASYVGELARGVLDPGAVTIALFFESGALAAGSEREWPPLTEA